MYLRCKFVKDKLTSYVMMVPQEDAEVTEKTRKPRARKTPLTRTKVLRTALRLADKGGIEGLSMRKLASALKVEAMSLYNHVANKDDLLEGLVELVVAEVHVPVIGGDWREQMRLRAQSAHRVLMAHGWATQLFVSRANVGPNMLRYVDATIGCLTAAGFSYADADHAWNVLDAHIYGFTQIALNFPFEPDEYADVAEEYTSQTPMDDYPHLMGMSLEVMSGRHDGRHTLDFGLELILDGLQRSLSSRRP